MSFGLSRLKKFSSQVSKLACPGIVSSPPNDKNFFLLIERINKIFLSRKNHFSKWLCINFLTRASSRRSHLLEFKAQKPGPDPNFVFSNFALVLKHSHWLNHVTWPVLVDLIGWNSVDYVENYAYLLEFKTQKPGSDPIKLCLQQLDNRFKKNLNWLNIV